MRRSSCVNLSVVTVWSRTEDSNASVVPGVLYTKVSSCAVPSPAPSTSTTAASRVKFCSNSL